MSDQIKSARIICTGGLDSTQNHLSLSETKPGCATTLVNYEVGLNGGYRRLNGYQDFDSNFTVVGGAAGEGQVTGIIIFDNLATHTTQFIAARKDASGNTYSFYLYDSDTGWGAITTGLSLVYSGGGQSATKLRWDVGSDGTKNYLAIADGVNNAILYDGSTWAFLSPDGTGVGMSTAGGDQLISAPTTVTFFMGSLFLGRDVRNDYQGVISYSAANKFYDFTAANGGGQLTIGFDVVQHKPFRNELYIFGKNAIKKGIVNSGSNAGDAPYLVQDVTSNIGCIATDSVIEIGGDLVFLGPDGFRPISGTDKIGDVELECISVPVRSFVLSKIQSNDLVDVNTVVVRGKSQFRLFIGADNYLIKDAPGIIGGLRSSDPIHGWEFGELKGFRASCAASRYVGSTEYVLRGDYDGHVYRDEIGNDLNGADMVSVFETPYLDLSNTEFRKLMRRLKLFLRPEGSVTIQMAVTFDWNDPDVARPSDYTFDLEADAVDYDSGVLYDSGQVYDGTLRTMSFDNIQGSCFAVQFTFTTNGDFAPHTIQAYVLTYSVEGQR